MVRKQTTTTTVLLLLQYYSVLLLIVTLQKVRGSSAGALVRQNLNFNLDLRTLRKIEKEHNFQIITAYNMPHIQTLFIMMQQLLGLLICAALCLGKESGPSTYTFARSVASTRALVSDRTDTCYHEPLAKWFAGEEAMKQAGQKDPVKHYARNQVSGVVRRHMIIDELMCEAIGRTHGPRQVVILGAGFESRSYRFKHLPVRWFEIDLPEPAIEKERILKERGISDDPQIIKRVKLDLVTGDWVTALKEAGWDPTAPTFYILEGLIYYMTTDEAIALLTSIPHVPDSRIALSIIESSLQRVFESYGVPKDTWKTNLRKLRKAKAFDMPHYKLTWDSKLSPSRFDLTVSIPSLPARNPAERLRVILEAPCERVLEFVAA